MYAQSCDGDFEDRFARDSIVLVLDARSISRTRDWSMCVIPGPLHDGIGRRVSTETLFRWYRAVRDRYDRPMVSSPCTWSNHGGGEALTGTIRIGVLGLGIVWSVALWLSTGHGATAYAQSPAQQTFRAGVN